MKMLRPVAVLLVLIVSLLICAGCTSNSQPAAVVTAEPTATVAPTELPTAVAVCGIENCHGLTVTCGSNVATLCSSEMDPGDRCRQYASCQVESGSCTLVKESKFDKCVSCVKMCESSYYNNPNMMDDCSNKC